MIVEGNELIANLTNILNNNTASPSEIRKLAEEVRLTKTSPLIHNFPFCLHNLSDIMYSQTLALNLQLDPEEIKALANKIDETVSRLENVENIINNTRFDLALVNRLQDSANITR